MAVIKLKDLITESFNESEINILTSKYNRSTRRLLERKLDKVHDGIDKNSVKYTSVLKNKLSEQQWNNLRSFVLPITGLSEAGAVSDSDIAKSIAQLAKELTKGKMDVDPQDIDVSALDNPNATGDDLVKEIRVALNEGDPITTAILTAPSVLKLLANIFDWVGSYLPGVGNEESRAVTALLHKIYKYAKNNKDPETKKYLIPSKLEIIKEFELNKIQQKQLDAVFDRIGKFVQADNKKGKARAALGKNPAGAMDTVRQAYGPGEIDKSFHAGKFDTSGSTEQYISAHVLHVIHDASFDTKVGKAIGKFAHSLHELFLVPFKHVVAAAIWLGSKAKIGIKKGWNWLKSKLGMDSSEVTDIGITYEEAYKKSTKVADGLYTFSMFIFAIYELSHYAGDIGEMATRVKELLSNAKDSSVIMDIYNTISSELTTVYNSVSDAVKAGDLGAEITAIATETWKTFKSYIEKRI
jgi:hypothetical protein